MITGFWREISVIGWNLSNTEWEKKCNQRQYRHFRGPVTRAASLTVSLPNKMSTYGMTSMRGSLKNWLMKGAERFMQKILSWSEACFATFRIDSGDTVKKKPWKNKKTKGVFINIVFGRLAWTKSNR